MGTRFEEKHRWWKRILFMGNWNEFAFREKLKKLEKENTLNGKALCVQFNGDLIFLRRDLSLSETLTKAIAQSAMKCGSAKSKTSSTDHEMRREIRRVLNEDEKMTQLKAKIVHWIIQSKTEGQAC